MDLLKSAKSAKNVITKADTKDSELLSSLREAVDGKIIEINDIAKEMADNNNRSLRYAWQIILSQGAYDAGLKDSVMKDGKQTYWKVVDADKNGNIPQEEVYIDKNDHSKGKKMVNKKEKVSKDIKEPSITPSQVDAVLKSFQKQIKNNVLVNL